jgi:hypothetical protein
MFAEIARRKIVEFDPDRVSMQADSRGPFIGDFLVSQNHVNMRVGG